jgi:hypothetical protein
MLREIWVGLVVGIDYIVVYQQRKLVCYSIMYAISHRKSVENINRWFGG